VSSNGFYKVGNGVHEGMFVADNVAGRPPISDIRVIRLSNHDFTKSARLLGISRTACSTRLSRALQKLEEKVGDDVHA